MTEEATESVVVETITRSGTSPYFFATLSRMISASRCSIQSRSQTSQTSILRIGELAQGKGHRSGHSVAEEGDDRLGAPLQPQPKHGRNHLLQLLAILIAQPGGRGDR